MARGMGLSWGQRKSLGQRYSTDPAYDLEQQRLTEEYAQLPGRRALALSREQLALNDQRNRDQLALQQQGLDLQKDRDKQSGTSSMVGTAGNVAGMYLLQGGGKDIYNGAGKLVGAAKNYLYPSQQVTQEGMGLFPSQAASEAAGNTFAANSTAIPAVGTEAAYTGMGSLPYGETPALIDAAAEGTYTGMGSLGYAPATEIGGIGVAPIVETGTAAGAEAAGTAAGIGASSASYATIPVIGAAIAAALASKEGGRKFAKGGSDEIGGYGPAKYLANVSQHPVASVMNPGAWLTDTGLVDEDTLVGQIVSVTSRIEDAGIKWVTDTIGNLFG